MLDWGENSTAVLHVSSPLASLGASSFWGGWQMEEEMLVVAQGTQLLSGPPLGNRNRLPGCGEACLIWLGGHLPCHPWGQASLRHFVGLNL